MNTAPPTHRFVILAVPRTGSNLLCTLLNSHPEIVCHHELFNPQGIFAALDHRDRDLGLGTVEDRDRRPLEFLDRVWRAVPNRRWVGFKWTRGQDLQVFRSVVGDRAIRKIVLGRRNRIKTYISDKIARQTQQWEVYRCDDLHQPRPRVLADKDELLAHAQANGQFYADLQASLISDGQPYLETCYERLLDRGEQRRWLKFLAVTDVDYPLRAESVKQNSCDLRELIANFAEFRERLDDREFQAELADRRS